VQVKTQPPYQEADEEKVSKSLLLDCA